MKELKDYLHLYLGCEVMYGDEAWKLKSVEIGINGNVCGKITRKRPESQTYDIENYEFRNGSTPIKPILRSLSSMTEEEFAGFKKLADNDFSKMVIIESISKEGDYTRLCHQAEAQRYLLSKHFDLFDLIPSGLAIDKLNEK